MHSNLYASIALSFGLSINANAAPTVAVDIAPLHSLVSQVMGDVGQPKLLIPAEASPHQYSLRPSEAKALADSDVVFWVGESLSPWLEKAMENLASSSQKIEVLNIEGTTSHEFREGATFEEESHGDEAEGGHGGEHGFEWAGAFELSAGEYRWTFAKVDGDYADPQMKMVFLASDLKGAAAIEALEEKAEELLESESAPEKVHGDALTASDSNAYQLVFDPKKNVTEYSITIKKKGIYTFFTEHMPFEFEADEHFLKDLAKQDIEPSAQEPDSGHGHHHHGDVDPHAWLDPENAKVWVREIKEVLSKKDPKNAQAYESNAKQTIDALNSLIETTGKKIKSLDDPKFIVFHDAYQYFEKRFGIAAAGSISLGDAEDPSPARIKEIRDVVKKLGVNCVFTEPQYNPGLVKNVFKGTTVSTIGVMDPLGASLTVGSGHYQELIQGMVKSISQCN